ncbi:CU044_2847 family protein (plasmid) [Streptomyces sp. HUAS TT3]|uniref:CU044_2847 family protein n=1 Tax=unclassified Streptomyces TaxID=2593676 RepID=UPI003679EAB7
MGNAGELRLTDGSGIWVEVADADGDGIERVGRAGAALARAGETLQEAMGQIRPALDVIADGLRGMAQVPESVRVDFGIKLSGETGIVVAKAAAEANFTVSVEWRPRTGAEAAPAPASGADAGPGPADSPGAA